jgi:nitrite reductase/ring-hydroxylating ferredoxin subunit
MISVLSENFVKVADTKDIQPSQMKEVQVNGEAICIVNIDGKYYAFGNVCTHEGGPLADGTLDSYEIECPWHGSKFDVRTGEVTNPPASEPESTYEVRVEDNNILVKKITPTAELSQSYSRSPSEHELTLLQRKKFEGTDVLSFKLCSFQDSRIDLKLVPRIRCSAASIVVLFVSLSAILAN